MSKDCFDNQSVQRLEGEIALKLTFATESVITPFKELFVSYYSHLITKMQRTNSSNAIPHRKKDEEFTARFSSMRVDSPCNSPCSSPKTRKPYSVSKSREVWTPDEHQRFIEALKL